MYPVSGTEPDGGSQQIFTSRLGNVTSNYSLVTRIIGISWPSFSCNYAGQVYFADSSAGDVVFELPPNVTAWSGVIEPISPDGPLYYEITVFANDGTTARLTQSLFPVDGAGLFGFVSFNGATISKVTVISDPTSGGFNIAQMQVSDSIVCLSGTTNVCTTSQVIKG